MFSSSSYAEDINKFGKSRISCAARIDVLLFSVQAIKYRLQISYFFKRIFTWHTHWLDITFGHFTHHRNTDKLFNCVVLDHTHCHAYETHQKFKAGVHVKAVLTSLNTAFQPISRPRFKQRQIPMLISLTTVWRF